VKNQKLFGSHNYENVVAHVASGVAREKKKKGCSIWHSFAFVVVRTFHARI
jgi:hypothetical protein